MVESIMGALAAISFGFLWTIAKAAFWLGFVIFVHELGHFLVAKWCGVKCEKFYVGFDVPISIGPIRLPRALFRKKWGETEYGIGIVPLGGYVKMLGQDDNPANSAREAERIRLVREGAASGASVASADASGAAPESADAAYEIDPRSYPAKTVPQRLAIISAGVIMNLIFAVIFSAVAYRMGVSYTPTVLGSTSPGLSGWTVGLKPGDRILQLGRDGTPSRQLRFQEDMTVKAMMTGANRDLDLLVERYAPPGEKPAEPEWVTVRLSSPQASMQDRPMIGVSPSLTTRVGVTPELKEIFSHLPANQVPLEAGDRIVAVNGESVQDYIQLLKQLAQNVDKELILTVEPVVKDSQGKPVEPPQNSAETKQVTIPRFPVRSLGIHLTMGPIVGIQKGSVAEKAGFQLGDRILTVAGQAVQDPMELPHLLRKRAGQETPIEVQRKGSDERVSLVVTPVPPEAVQMDVSPGRPVAVEEIGVAYQIENTIAAIEPGSPASRAGLEVGDLVQTVEFVPSKEGAEREKKGLRSEPIELGKESLSWPAAQFRMQMSLPDTKVRLSVQRGSQLKTAEMQPVDLPDRFFADRGLQMQPMQDVHQVDDWATAAKLGVRETIEGMRQVYMILYQLVTGQFSPKNLGGPVSIATVAGMKASEGTAELLVFLTLLSANLAVVNFLPIPVLDGGHAMFLLYEGIFKKPVNERVAFGLTMLGFCFILGLMLFVLGLDVLRLAQLAG